MIPGVKIAMGGEDWMIPPLTLGQLRRLMPKIQTLVGIGAEMNDEQIGVLVEIVVCALQRNYPELTAETVAELLDLGNASRVLSAVLTGSGLRPVRPGEALAGSPIGAASTVSSPLPADIPTRPSTR